MKRILIVGAGGQIGSELTVYLRKIYGGHNVVATDMRECKSLGEDGPFEVLNALDATAMASVVARHRIDPIFCFQPWESGIPRWPGTSIWVR